MCVFVVIPPDVGFGHQALQTITELKERFCLTGVRTKSYHLLNYFTNTVSRY